MKRDITLAIDQQLLKRAGALAAQRGLSISRMLAEEWRSLVAQDTACKCCRSWM